MSDYKNKIFRKAIAFTTEELLGKIDETMRQFRDRVELKSFTEYLVKNYSSIDSSLVNAVDEGLIMEVVPSADQEELDKLRSYVFNHLKQANLDVQDLVKTLDLAQKIKNREIQLTGKSSAGLKKIAREVLPDVNHAVVKKWLDAFPEPLPVIENHRGANKVFKTPDEQSRYRINGYDSHAVFIKDEWNDDPDFAGFSGRFVIKDNPSDWYSPKDFELVVDEDATDVMYNGNFVMGQQKKDAIEHFKKQYLNKIEELYNKIRGPVSIEDVRPKDRAPLEQIKERTDDTGDQRLFASVKGRHYKLLEKKAEIFGYKK